MKIYLMRHGHALDNINDERRPLSPEGLEQVERTAAHLLELNLPIKVVYHSSLLRAKESAIHLCHHLKLSAPVERKGLRPNDDIMNFCEEVRYLEEETLFVGHMPFMADALCELTGKSISFNTAEMVAIELGEKKGELLWRSSHL